MNAIEQRKTKGRRVFAALLLPAALVACDPLEVENPTIIETHELMDTALVQALVDGIAARFQRMYTNNALYSGMFSDELIDGHVFAPHRPFDRRDIIGGDQRISDWMLYGPPHLARGAGDSLTARVETLLGAKAGTSIELARGRALAGYTYVILGEQLCESPINAGPPLTPAQLLEEAIKRFENAIQIAQAGRSSKPASADSVINLARVGAARAALQLGDKARAIQFASQVPATFSYWVYHSSNPGEENPFENATAGGKDLPGTRFIGLDPAFEGLNDLRIPHTPTRVRIMDGREFLVPYQPMNFSGWKPGQRIPFDLGADLRFASGLEARYIVAEAGGMTAAQLRQFIDERRAVGGQPPFTGPDAGLFRELLDQRRRDLFLTAHRLGDLRRFKALYGLDFWPKGVYPQTTEEYGTNECIPVSVAERTGNPYYRGK